eukprot:CAMPEP_0204592088 /NCGR_PEP_ID=MMETSP0661-20131031/50732_1 /ASSEMBLY_ACC=CAM_ASM_000606 /TAXON_ID=109239 /ORGANISM="Alexandrium margalefi, Strain AMGDE01CS-322" /LENGTH=140 /DNA_ID=CAMNT_0051602269 /DNA_START=81 /DNA_END=501 /DNA_ORIENTATION=-
MSREDLGYGGKVAARVIRTLRTDFCGGAMELSQCGIELPPRGGLASERLPLVSLPASLAGGPDCQRRQLCAAVAAHGRLYGNSACVLAHEAFRPPHKRVRHAAVSCVFRMRACVLVSRMPAHGRSPAGIMDEECWDPVCK